MSILLSQNTIGNRDTILKEYGLELNDTGLKLIKSLIRPQQVSKKTCNNVTLLNGT